jgi:hypothetical protein
MSVQQELVVRQEMTRPHASVEMVELESNQGGLTRADGLAAELSLVDVAQGEPRNAGPPLPESVSRCPQSAGWGVMQHEGVMGYGERLANGKVRYWRPLPERH